MGCVGARKHHALPSSFEITFKELYEALMSNFAAGERKTPEETLFERQTKLQAAVQQTNTSIAGFKSELTTMKREGRAAGRAAGNQLSPGKVKKLKTLANDIKLKKDTIAVFQNTLSSQLQQLKKVN